MDERFHASGSKKNKKANRRNSSISFDEKAYEVHKAIIALIMGHFMLRHMNRLYHAFDGDLVMPIVLGEIAHHNIIKLYSRSGNCFIVRDRIDKEQPKILEPTNAYSISEATGIPRETIRRKIDKLVKEGWLIKSPRGEVTISETVGEHFMSDFNKISLAELLETSNCIKEILDSGASGTCI